LYDVAAVAQAFNPVAQAFSLWSPTPCLAQLTLAAQMTIRPLRCDPDNRFRVFYSVSHATREVQILAVGRKEGNRLMIGREEIKL